jgi:cytochrome P450
MADVLTADDPRYNEMFDVRNEALEMGNLVESDMNDGFRELRERGSVHQGSLRELLKLPPATHGHRYSRERPAYTCFSYDACSQAFRDNETFSSQLYLDVPGIQALGKTIIEMVGPEHRRYRATLQPMFIKPKAMRWWRERWIDEIVANLVESLRRDSRAELNLQFCARMPVHTVTRGIGVDGEDALSFRQALLKMIGIARVTPAEQGQGAKDVERMLFEIIAKRRAEPGDDVISGLLATELELEDGSRRPLTDQEIMANCRLIILAGGGTTWRQTGITLWALMSNPEQYEAVKADRSLIEKAIHESVRWNPTDPVFSRLVTVDTTLDGHAVPANVVLDVCLGAANRDAARWENPEVYDLHRPYQSHLGFTLGAHQCLGMHVATAEMSVALNALFDAFPNMRLDPDAPAPELIGGLDPRGMSALPVLLD